MTPSPRTLLVGASLAFATSAAHAQLSINWSTLDCGGGTSTAGGGTLALSGTIGQPDAGAMTAGALTLHGGFWAGTHTPPCPADFNGDGFLNPDDLADFITCFFLDVQFPGFCQGADFNTDGFRNPDDLADFITVFFLGC